MTLRLYRVLRFARIMVSSRSSSTIMSSTPSAPICLTVFSREVSPVMGVKGRVDVINVDVLQINTCKLKHFPWRDVRGEEKSNEKERERGAGRRKKEEGLRKKNKNQRTKKNKKRRTKKKEKKKRKPKEKKTKRTSIKEKGEEEEEEEEEVIQTQDHPKVNTNQERANLLLWFISQCLCPVKFLSQRMPACHKSTWSSTLSSSRDLSRWAGESNNKIKNKMRKSASNSTSNEFPYQVPQ